VRITSLGFRTDVALRVQEGADVADRGDYLVIRTLDNPDYWWGNFLLLARLPGPGQGQAWVDTFAAEFPAARHVALGVDVTAIPEIPEDFAAAGLTADRATVLTAAELSPPAHPCTDAEIRPLEGDADWRQSVDLASRCFDAGDPGDFLERRAAARRRLTQTGAGVWFGAFTGGRLLAQLGLFDVGHGYARYQHVETDPAARRRGLAGTLVWTAGRYGRAVLGSSTLVIVADPAGAAIRLYRACGFTARQRQLSFDRPPGPSA
jgi:ribosomal protein S18 acetylase RimI-like enzyme